MLTECDTQIQEWK